MGEHGILERILLIYAEALLPMVRNVNCQSTPRGRKGTRRWQ